MVFTGKILVEVINKMRIISGVLKGRLIKFLKFLH